MFCRHCGKEIEEGGRFCKYCGQPVILAQGNGPAAAEGADPNAGNTEHTEQYSGTDRVLSDGTAHYEERTGYNEQYQGGGRTPAGPAAPGHQEYTEKFSRQNGPVPSPGEFPENDYQRRQPVRGENYIAPAGLREKKKKTNDNSLTILLGAIAAVLFVTLGFLVYRIFLADSVSGGGKDITSSVQTATASADDTKSAGKGAGSGASGTGRSGSGTSSAGGSGSGTAGSGQTEPDVTVEEMTGFEAVEKKANSAAYPGTMDVVSADVTDYPSIKLYCSLTDSTGEGIVLQSPTAGIRETISGGGEIEREIISIERLEGNQGIGFDILVDKSSSMSDELPQMQSILTEFITSLDYGSGDAAEIISFDTYVMYMCMYTDNMSNLLNGISNMSTYGRTALYDALVEGISNAGSRTGANCVIAFTDGEDNESRYSYEEVVNLALARDVPVYIIGLGTVDSVRLGSLSEQTGGCYWDINSITDMSEILSTIYEQEKDLYCVEYVSDGSADPYSSRSVSCAIADDTSGGVIYNYGYTAAQRKEEVSHASRYELVIGDYSWSEANSDALSKGGHLVTITSQDEMNRIAAMGENAGLKYIWMGGYTSVRNGAAYGHWTTGEPFAFAPWYPGEPSRNDLDGVPEFYLIFWNVEGVWSFNDERDDVAADLPSYRGKMGYVIEYEN